MNFELMAKLLLEKGDLRLSAEIFKRLSIKERQDLVSNIDCINFLKNVKQELEKAVTYDDKEAIMTLINDRISAIAAVKYGCKDMIN
jgi:hypothetical protein